MEPAVREEIKEIIRQSMIGKIDNYSPETEYKPFATAIFSQRITTIASIIQSSYTTFGMSIYEQIAVILARAQNITAERQYALTGQIDDTTELLIQRLCLHNTAKEEALRQIRASIQPGRHNSHDEGIVDVYLKYATGKEVFIDITTVKPNLKEFKAMRLKLLRWAALRMSTNRNAQVDTRIGIPYNPYNPEPYTRWTSGKCDFAGDLLVQNDLWTVFAGHDVFPELITIFEEIGLELESKLAAMFPQD